MPGDKQFTLKNFEEVEILLELKERRNRTPPQGVPA